MRDILFSIHVSYLDKSHSGLYKFINHNYKLQVQNFTNIHTQYVDSTLSYNFTTIRDKLRTFRLRYKN